MNPRGFRVGYRQQDLGRVIHRLKVKVALEHNKMLPIWEHELRLHVKPRPRFFPQWLWSWLENLVLVQSSETIKAPNYVHKEDIDP